MAGLQLQPPETFDFRTPDDWLRWLRQFSQFRIASGLAAKDPVQQVSTLLYCIGEEVDSVLESTGISEDK